MDRTRRIELTPTEANIAEWAIGPMREYGEELLECNPSEAWGSEAVPVLNGRLLDISAVTRSSMEDFVYRVGVQYTDMIDGGKECWVDEYLAKGMDLDRAQRCAGAKARREYAAADSLVKKVRENRKSYTVGRE